MEGGDQRMRDTRHYQARAKNPAPGAYYEFYLEGLAAVSSVAHLLGLIEASDGGSDENNPFVFLWQEFHAREADKALAMLRAAGLTIDSPEHVTPEVAAIAGAM